MAERTGTALRPAPGSSANRTPVTAVGGRPARMAPVAAHDVEGPRSRAWRAAPGREADERRHECDQRRARARRPTTPRPTTVQSACTSTAAGTVAPVRAAPEATAPTATSPAKSEPDDHRAQRADETVPECHRRARPESPHDVEIRRRRRIRRLITCPAMRSAATPAMPPKTPSAMASGRSVLSAVAYDARRLHVDEREALGQDALTSVSTVERYRLPPCSVSAAHHVVAATRQELVGEGRREEHDRLAVRRVPVLEHRGRLTPGDADQLDPRPLFDGDLLVRREVPRLRLRVGQPTDGDLLPDVIPERLRAGRVQDELVGVVRVGHPPSVMTSRSSV